MGVNAIRSWRHSRNARNVGVLMVVGDANGASACAHREDVGEGEWSMTR